MPLAPLRRSCDDEASGDVGVGKQAAEAAASTSGRSELKSRADSAPRVHDLVETQHRPPGSGRSERARREARRRASGRDPRPRPIHRPRASGPGASAASRARAAVISASPRRRRGSRADASLLFAVVKSLISTTIQSDGGIGTTLRLRRPAITSERCGVSTTSRCLSTFRVVTTATSRSAPTISMRIEGEAEADRSGQREHEKERARVPQLGDRGDRRGRARQRSVVQQHRQQARDQCDPDEARYLMHRERPEVSAADAGQHEDEQHGQREREPHGGGGHERDIGEAVATEHGPRGPEQHGAENQDGCKELTVLHGGERGQRILREHDQVDAAIAHAASGQKYGLRRSFRKMRAIAMPNTGWSM